ncbi:MAG: bifunctional nuclease family protein [Halobacteriota archaeon]|uniref:bifunctional nuclease family protein n=1 Tax=Halanaeroarchaeum sp. HSR-CO TaxID=2866382 RepID=UPI00217E8DFB|nr:bifunctional nuclease family protein [Halanaeroarchaeum sp. HSR-CO]UWG47673.1 Bifunctional nuclease, with DNase and RNase activity [Halanaeroarchaeum sp. HSR-CO]
MDHEATVRGVAVTDEDERVPAVLLDVRDEILPVFVTGDQAQSIQIALSPETFERPLTHDLFVEMLTEFGAAIDRVRIDELREGTFYGKLDVEQYDDGNRTEMTFDVRPSDAIAIAVRVDAPIFVSDEVVDAAGQEPDSVRFEEE